MNEYELITSNSFFILGVVGSALLLIIGVRATGSTITSKSFFFNKWDELATLMTKQHKSNYVMKWFLAVSGSLLLA